MKPSFHRHPGHASFMGSFPHPPRRAKYNVPINIEDRDDCYLVSVYATGFDKAQIKLSVIEDILFISGTRDLDEGAHIEFVQQEFPIHSFERSLPLNGWVHTDLITAKQESGIVWICLPKLDSQLRSGTQIQVR